MTDKKEMDKPQILARMYTGFQIDFDVMLFLIVIISIATVFFLQLLFSVVVA